MTAWSTHLASARALWQQRPLRERRWLTLGAIVLLGALLWSGLLMPAWRTWKQAPEQQAWLETQTRHMLQLQTEARQLQAPQNIDRVQALQRLGSSAQTLLGSTAQLQAQGDELRVTLQRASASSLTEWLVQAREKAHSLPRQVQLQKHDADNDTASRKDAPADGQTSASWSGTLVLRLP